MHILLTNDDGIDAPGLRALEPGLRRLGRLTVVAPEHPRSAVGASITLHKPIRVRKAGRNRFAIEGTPTDCVKLALAELCERPPGLVVSGINEGRNTGRNIFYSGTVAAALEAAQRGIAAVAVSLQLARNPDFSLAADLGLPLIRKLSGWNGVVFNINIPARPRSRIRGILVTRQEPFPYRDAFRRRSDPRGRPYYWLCQRDGAGGVRGEGLPSDEQAVRRGFISVTPLRPDLTDEGVLSELEKVLGQE